MKGFFMMVKANLKLLFRNKGYLSLVILLPILSAGLLSLQLGDTVSMKDDSSYMVQNIEDRAQNITSIENTKLLVKIYDNSNTTLSDYIAQELAGSGIFRVFRYNREGVDRQSARAESIDSAGKSNIGAVVYIPEDFETKLLSGGTGDLSIMEITNDGRNDLLNSQVNTYLNFMMQAAASTDYDKSALDTLLSELKVGKLSKQIESVEVRNNITLTSLQNRQSTRIGYSIAALTIGFLFCGIFIADIIVKERNNKVYNRIFLSKASMLNYILAKMSMIVLTVAIQTAILAMVIPILVNTDFGIPFSSYLFLVFGLGLCISTLSVVIGTMVSNTMNATYAVFGIWIVSNIMAGLYFPISNAAQWWLKASLLIPQRWVILASEMLMTGARGVYLMYTLIVACCLFVLMASASIGILIAKKEN
ncbi:ABC transporter permease [Acetobacterium woodii]|uniref:ABC transport system permease protein n=1 Tax=Acetobacterium woodii (strain ATCC 29683 / DSM 1030 / JCM 2381 / KCTC 1655 / WB1) TaxID=931626 RepID=H6LJK7_ACEWD|nr:ABC transporter permease [Acetobacterium woodii]AFA49935.1 ABC transport system permease protein [Acetobacterium woodii DSM 1030]